MTRKLHRHGNGRDGFNKDKHALLTMWQARLLVENSVSLTMLQKLGDIAFPAQIIFGLRR